MRPLGKTVLTALLTLLLAAALTAVPTAAAHAASPESYARAAHRATNEHRAEHDLRRLRRNRCLTRFATRQARAMARQQSMFHQDLGPVLARCRLRMVGENVAYGYRSGRAAVGGWMSSPDHRANLLHPGYRLMAVAARKDRDGVWYSAQVFGRR